MSESYLVSVITPYYSQLLKLLNHPKTDIRVSTKHWKLVRLTLSPEEYTLIRLTFPNDAVSIIK